MFKSFRFVKKIEFSHYFSSCLIIPETNKIIIPFRKLLKLIDISNNHSEFIDTQEVEIDDVFIRREYLSNSGNSSFFRVYSNKYITVKAMIRTDVSLLNRVVKCYELDDENAIVVGYDYYSQFDSTFEYVKFAQKTLAYDKDLNETAVYKLYLNNRTIFLYKKERPLLIKLKKNTYFNIKDNRFIITDEAKPSPSWFENWDY